MKKAGAWILMVVIAAGLAGCAKKTVSEQLQEDMEKMQRDLNKSAKKIQNELK